MWYQQNERNSQRKSNNNCFQPSCITLTSFAGPMLLNDVIRVQSVYCKVIGKCNCIVVWQRSEQLVYISNEHKDVSRFWPNSPARADWISQVLGASVVQHVRLVLLLKTLPINPDRGSKAAAAAGEHLIFHLHRNHFTLFCDCVDFPQLKSCSVNKPGLFHNSGMDIKFIRYWYKFSLQ